MNHPILSFNQLKKKVDNVTDTFILPSKTGCSVMSEYGGRVLGLFPTIDSFNTLWTAPDIDTLITDKKPNIGGERLWIAPQRNFFFKRPQSFEDYFNQHTIDPGDYHKINDSLFISETTIEDYYAKSNCKATFTRQFSTMPDPYNTDLPFAGVKTEDSITIDNPKTDFCAWSISQVYTTGPDQPGTAIIPIVNNGHFVEYFTKTPSHYFKLQESATFFRIDAIETYKIGVSPSALALSSTIKVAYLSKFPESSTWFLVVKRSDDLPSSQDECVDISSIDQNGDKGAVQVYNGFTIPGKPCNPFGEIELQFKPAKTSDDISESKGTHELLSYIGSKEELLQLLELMMSSRVDSSCLF